MKNFIYIEIVKKENNEVVKRIDVSTKSESQIMRTEMGVLINLNHEEYYTRETESQTELKAF